MAATHAYPHSSAAMVCDLTDRQGGGGWRSDKDDLWRDFPKTATEFEARFATEEDCRAYWIEARWGGEPACARCGSKRVWTIRDGTTFECARLRPSDEPDVGHAAGEDAQAVQGVVPRGVRDLDAAHRHLGQGPAAHHGLRLLQDGVDLAAQAQRGDGASRREPLGPCMGSCKVKSWLPKCTIIIFHRQFLCSIQGRFLVL